MPISRPSPFPILLCACLLLWAAPARADEAGRNFAEWVLGPLAMQGNADGWGTWYLFGESDSRRDEGAGGVGVMAFGDPWLVLRGAWFVSADKQQLWSGVEGSAGVALPLPVTPYAALGGLVAAVDDSTDGNERTTVIGIEGFAEWGAMLRLRPLWACWTRRTYLGDGGVPRGEKSTMVSVGWTFDFE
ncbi:MAG: hypothetical protein HZA24_10255 [Nitrospirae bacterium]|nr:hypothetical protein [Nitrospirota bacterium]